MHLKTWFLLVVVVALSSSGCSLVRQQLNSQIQAQTELVSCLTFELEFMPGTNSVVDTAHGYEKEKRYAEAERLLRAELSKYQSASDQLGKKTAIVLRYEIARMEMLQSENDRAEADFKAVQEILEHMNPQPKSGLAAVATSYSLLLHQAGRTNQTKP